VGTSTRRRLTAAAAVALLLAAGACSKDPAAPPAPGPTAPTAGSSASGAPVPAPSSVAPSSVAPSSVAPGPSTGAPSGSAAPSSTLPPPATTPVPAPTPGGGIDQTVAPQKEVTKKPVKLDKPSDTGEGASVRITSVKAINAKAQLPGEVAGPGVALTVVVKNSSAEPLNIGTVVVSLLDATGAPGNEMSSAPAKPFSGTLASGKTATGVYVFTVGKQRREPISVSVTLTGGAPVLVFKGNAD
jgi:hypothetical protein